MPTTEEQLPFPFDRATHRAMVDAGYVPLSDYVERYKDGVPLVDTAQLAPRDQIAQEIFSAMLRVNDPAKLWDAMEDILNVNHISLIRPY